MTSYEAVRGRQVLLDGTLAPATVRIADGRVAEILPYDVSVTGEPFEVPDGAYLLPGVVDTHVHVNEPGRTAWEGFATATRAAVLGGVTTLVDMPLNSIPPTTTLDHLAVKQAAATGKLAADVGFWAGAIPGNVPDLEPLWAAGVLGFKCFLADSGVEEFPPLSAADFTTHMAEIARLGALMVVHAEDATVLEAARRPSSRAYATFLLSRPDEAETTAVRQVIEAVRETGARAHVLHLSSARALDLLAEAKAEGLPLSVETCPHYLVFSASDIPDASPEFKCCPPIRDEGNRKALWEALRTGVIDCVVSDHSPASPEEKRRGDGDYQQAWGGISGLQVGFAAVAAEAARRDIGIEQVSDWMSARTAALVGLSDKGRIAVGADADLTVYDPSHAVDVEASRLAHRHPISAYDGLRLSGSVTTTILRGRVAGDPAWGRQLRRTA